VITLGGGVTYDGCSDGLETVPTDLEKMLLKSIIRKKSFYNMHIREAKRLKLETRRIPKVMRQKIGNPITWTDEQTAAIFLAISIIESEMRHSIKMANIFKAYKNVRHPKTYEKAMLQIKRA
jgi:hypothetical protein